MDGDFGAPVRKRHVKVRPQAQPPATPPQEREQTVTQKPAAKVRHTKLRLLIASAAALLLAAGAVTYLYAHRDTNPLTRYTQQVSFPLYYPTSTPGDYIVDPASVKVSGELVVYSLSSASQKSSIAMTLQATPPNFDANKLVGKDSGPTVAVGPGALYDLSAGQQSKYMLTTGNGTLIFINSTSKIDSGTINSLASSLHEVK